MRILVASLGPGLWFSSTAPQPNSIFSPITTDGGVGRDMGSLKLRIFFSWCLSVKSSQFFCKNIHTFREMAFSGRTCHPSVTFIAFSKAPLFPAATQQCHFTKCCLSSLWLFLQSKGRDFSHIWFILRRYFLQHQQISCNRNEWGDLASVLLPGFSWKWCCYSKSGSWQKAALLTHRRRRVMKAWVQKEHNAPQIITWPENEKDRKLIWQSWTLIFWKFIF